MTPRYPESRFDRAQGRAIDRANADYLAALKDAGAGACPNCLKQGGGHCWLCVEPVCADCGESAEGHWLRRDLCASCAAARAERSEAGE